MNLKLIAGFLLFLLATKSFGQASTDTLQILDWETLARSDDEKARDSATRELIRTFRVKDRDRAMKYRIYYYSRLPIERQKEKIDLGMHIGWTLANRFALVDSGLTFIDTNIVRAEALNDSLLIGRGYTYKGQALKLKTQYKSASEWIWKSIEVKKNVNPEGVGFSMDLIASIYKAQGFYEKAVRYHRRAAAIKLKHDKKEVAFSYQGLGSSYMFLNQKDSSLKYFNLAIELRRANRQTNLVGVCANRIARAYRHFGEPEKAMPYHEEAIRVWKKLKIKVHAPTTLLNLAETQAVLGQHQVALENAEKALALEEYCDRPRTLLRIHQFLQEEYALQKQPEKSLRHLILATAIKDSIYSIESAAQVAELEERYKNKENQLLIRNLETREQQQKLKLDHQAIRNRTSRSWLIGLSIALLSIVVFLGVLRRKNKALKAGIEERKVLLSEVHHRVKNNLQIVAGLLYIQAESIEDQKAQEALMVIRSRIDAMGLVHQKLYSGDAGTSVSSSSYISALLDDIFATFYEFSQDVVLEKDLEDVPFDIDTTIPLGLILNELITNAVKHAYLPHQTKKLKVSLKRKSEGLVLQVKDNGLTPQPEAQCTKEGGFGLKLIKSLARQLKAEIRWEREQGTVVWVHLPNYRKKRA